MPLLAILIEILVFVPLSSLFLINVLYDKDMLRDQSAFGSYIRVSFLKTSVCRFLFFFVLVCGILL